MSEIEQLKAQLETVRTALEGLKTAAILYYNEAPKEGDYAILILSLSGTVNPEHEEMMRKYNTTRKGLRNSIEALSPDPMLRQVG